MIELELELADIAEALMLATPGEWATDGWAITSEGRYIARVEFTPAYGIYVSGAEANANVRAIALIHNKAPALLSAVRRVIASHARSDAIDHAFRAGYSAGSQAAGDLSDLPLQDWAAALEAYRASGSND